MAVGDRMAGPDPAEANPGPLRATWAHYGTHALTTALHMRPCKRLGHRFAAAAGRGGGGDGGSGGACDARDAGGRAAAAGKLRDAHSRTLGHITGHTWCEQGHRTRQIWREFEGWGQLRTFLPSQKLPPVAP